MAAESSVGMHSTTSGTCSRSDQSGKLVLHYCGRHSRLLLPPQYTNLHDEYSVLQWPGPATCIPSESSLSNTRMSAYCYNLHLTICIEYILAVSLGLSLLQTIHTDLPVIYVTRGSLVTADSIVLVLTWIRTFTNWNDARRLNLNLSISTCLLRDGKSL